ncbi:MAG: hypothetical protein ACLGHT_00700 [Acidimicrobiia bacterium]
MSRFRRTLGTLLLAATLAGVTVGCGRAEQEALKEVRAALRKTAELSYRYVYDVEMPLLRAEYEIRGIVEDDLRYKTQLSSGGKPAIEEVVSDDTIATRFFEPALLKMYENPEGGRGDTGKRQGEAEEKLAPDVEVRSALQAGRWVLDPSGAPPLLGGAIDLRALGSDPLYESLTFIQYVEQVLRVNGVYEFNEDALDYRPNEDPFAEATPEKLFPGRKVKRYDIGRPPLPKASDTQAGNQITPGMEHFRYMAIYIEDGIIIRVDETIDPGLQLDDLRDNYDLDLPADPEEAVEVSIKAINAVRTAQGDPPVVLRRVSLQLASLGEKNTVALPQGEDLVVGSLSVLRGRGRSTAGEGLVTVPGSQAAQPDPATTEPAAAEPAEGTG